jgi:hypothetical protein
LREEVMAELTGAVVSRAMVAPPTAA